MAYGYEEEKSIERIYSTILILQIFPHALQVIN